MRTIIIGDIHGCYIEFISLLEKINFDETHDRLILLGDTMDRGPDSYDVLMECVRLKKVMKDRFVHIMGNHENLAIGAIRVGERELWNINGGGKTRKNFYKYNDRIERYEEYLMGLPLFYETDQFLCVHAGVAKENHETTAEEYLWDRMIAKGLHKYSGKLLIYGHTPMSDVIYRDADGYERVLPPDKIDILPKYGSICLDTGCVFGNKLSAIVIRKDILYKIVQVLSSEKLVDLSCTN